MSLGTPNVSALHALFIMTAKCRIAMGSSPGRAIGMNKTPGQQECKGVGVEA